MTDKELLLSISNIMDTKLNSLENRMDAKIDGLEAKVDGLEVNLHRTNLLIENQVLPRIKEIESCYLSTFERYQQETSKVEQLQLDVSVIKDVVIEHGEKIKNYQVCVS